MIFTNMEIILETNFNNIEKWFLNFTCKLNSANLSMLHELYIIYNLYAYFILFGVLYN